MSARAQRHSFDPFPRSLRLRQFQIFSSAASEPIEAKFHMEEQTFFHHMTKMAAMPICGKILKRLLLWNWLADVVET